MSKRIVIVETNDEAMTEQERTLDGQIVELETYVSGDYSIDVSKVGDLEPGQKVICVLVVPD